MTRTCVNYLWPNSEGSVLPFPSFDEKFWRNRKLGTGTEEALLAYEVKEDNECNSVFSLSSQNMTRSPIHVHSFLHVDVLFPLVFLPFAPKSHLLSSPVSALSIYPAVKNLGILERQTHWPVGSMGVFENYCRRYRLLMGVASELLKCLLRFQTYNFHLAITLRNTGVNCKSLNFT